MDWDGYLIDVAQFCQDWVSKQDVPVIRPRTPFHVACEFSFSRIEGIFEYRG